ncbi:MAG: NAD(P)-dependent oxidoreductase [Elusimicrobia bacterium]|nr:NAD(P)-dependent oxidoreductase [Elusimicrobiota bacterium]
MFLTGGTGFFGSWLLEALLAADEAFLLGARVCVLTRDRAAYRRSKPVLAGDRRVELLEGSLASLTGLPGRFTHVVHAGGDHQRSASAAPVADIEEEAAAGARRVLAGARAAGAGRLLFTSSGAVYGPQPADVELMDEERPFPEPAGAPATPAEGYARGKRRAERLLTAGAAGGPETVVARCYASLGPYMEVDGVFAAGNFVRDALRGGPVVVSGDGTPLRSYLYGADLAVWLWTLLLRGRAGRAYNVGSERAVSIAELAAAAARLRPGCRVETRGRAAPHAPPQRYVPSTVRARQQLGLRENIPLDAGLARTAEWLRGIS